MRHLFAVLLIAMGTIHLASATELFQDDFGKDIQHDTQTSLVNWTVVQGNVDVYNSGNPAPGCPSTAPGKCVDLDGTGGVLAIMQTKAQFQFRSGNTYQLFMDVPAVNIFMGGNHDSFRVTVGSVFSETFSGYSVPLSIVRTIVPAADEIVQIRIEMLDGKNNYGPLLTRVSLSCCVMGPQEASPSGDMRAYPNTGTSLFTVYTPACGATDHVIYTGQFPIQGGLAWTGAACALGTTGSASFDPGDPTVGSGTYFVIVGQTLTKEGSYGVRTGGFERPEAVGIGPCDLSQDLTGNCLPSP